MTIKNGHNRYPSRSMRLASWNYSWQGMYFVTICTVGREHFFGTIVNSNMVLSELGQIAENEWLKTPTVRPDMRLELDLFCIMPNHIHALITIDANDYNTGVDTIHYMATGNRFGPQAKNLASVVRGYKSTVTTDARKMDVPFGWQSKFYDHIVRHEAALDRIRGYIIANPQKWATDRFYNCSHTVGNRCAK